MSVLIYHRKLSARRMREDGGKSVAFDVNEYVHTQRGIFEVFTRIR